MEVQSDFRDAFALFNEHKIEYLIAGAFHGVTLIANKRILGRKKDLADLEALGEE